MRSDLIHRTTSSVVANMYKNFQQQKLIQPNIDFYVTMHHGILYYSDTCDVVEIRVGYNPLPVNPDYTLWLCVDPGSPNFKTLVQYINGAPVTWPSFVQYFVTESAQESISTLYDSLIPCVGVADV